MDGFLRHARSSHEPKSLRWCTEEWRHSGLEGLTRTPSRGSRAGGSPLDHPATSGRRNRPRASSSSRLRLEGCAPLRPPSGPIQPRPHGSGMRFEPSEPAPVHPARLAAPHPAGRSSCSQGPPRYRLTRSSAKYLDEGSETCLTSLADWYFSDLHTGGPACRGWPWAKGPAIGAAGPCTRRVLGDRCSVGRTGVGSRLRGGIRGRHWERSEKHPHRV